MRDQESLQRRIASLERRVHLLTLLTGVLSAAGLIAAARPSAGVLRARGLVITDAAGRDRIIVAAPMREASADTKLAQTVGLAVLDSLGRMNVAIGSDNPLVFADGRTGKRIASSAGLTIYDPRNGGERGGFGAFVDGRANMCLDWGAKGKEAACVSVAPGDQYAAVLLNGTPDQPQFDRVGLFAGAVGIGVVKAFGGGANNGGVSIKAGRGAPVIAVFDTTGKQIRDALARP
jgi:hypothetical protein